MNKVPPVVVKKKRKFPLESKVESRLKALIGTELGGISYKFSSPQRRGVFDQIAILPGGIVVFIEVKARDGVISAKQESFYKTCEQFNQLACYVYDHSGVDKFIEDMQRVLLAIRAVDQHNLTRITPSISIEKVYK